MSDADDTVRVLRASLARVDEEIAEGRVPSEAEAESIAWCRSVLECADAAEDPAELLTKSQAWGAR